MDILELLEDVKEAKRFCEEHDIDWDAIPVDVPKHEMGVLVSDHELWPFCFHGVL